MTLRGGVDLFLMIMIGSLSNYLPKGFSLRASLYV